MDIEVRVVGVVQILPGHTLLVLREVRGERMGAMFIGPFEANAIVVGMTKAVLPRPQTHDLLKNIVVDDLGYTVKKVVVTELRENTFYARLHLEKVNESRTVDCRPSDGIALAARTDSPIFVREQVFPDLERNLDQFNQPRDISGLSDKEARTLLENMDPDKLPKC